MAAITALIGDATERTSGSAPGAAAEDAERSAVVTGIALSTLLRPHAQARSIDAAEGARLAGDSVGAKRTRWSAYGALRTICNWTAWAIGASHKWRGSHCG